MKTRWSIDYLYRKSGNSARLVHEWKTAKLREFEARTGVKWTCWTEHGCVVFCSQWTKDTLEIDDPKVEAALLPVLIDLCHRKGSMGGATFLWLSERVGVELPLVISVCKKMTRDQKLVPGVGRCGGAVYVKLSPVFYRELIVQGV